METVIYLLGFVITWFFVVRDYLRNFPPETKNGFIPVDYMAGIWGGLVAVIWPIFWAGYAMAYLVQRKRK